MSASYLVLPTMAQFDTHMMQGMSQLYYNTSFHLGL